MVYFKLLLTVIVWGMSFVATKVLIPNIEPLSIVFCRTLFGALIMLALLRKRQVSLRIPLNSLPWFILFGFMAVYMHQWVQAYALYTSKASTATWIVATAPVFIAILGRFLLKEKFSFLKVTGIFLSFFGVLMVVSEGDIASALKNGLRSTGDIIILVTSFNWALFSVISRFFLNKHKDIPQIVVIFYTVLFGLILTSLSMPLKGDFKDVLKVMYDLRLFIAISFLGIFSTGFAYAFWYDALDVLEASKVGAFMYIQPLIGMVTAFLILGEPMGLSLFIGGGLILSGVYLVNRF